MNVQTNESLPIPVLCFGLTVRTGTNYIGSLMSHSTQVTSVPKTISHGEFPLLRKQIINKFEDLIASFNYAAFGVDNIPESIFQKGLAEILCSYFVKRYEIETPYVFFKDPSSVLGAQKVYAYFPNAKIFFTVRDGRDFVASFSKGSKLKRRKYSKMKKIKMSIKAFFGLNFVLASRQYSNAVENLIFVLKQLETLFPEKEFRVFKYEDLYLNAKDEIPKLFAYLDIPLTPQELDAMCNADVVGSSFYDSKKNVQNWKKAKRGKDFNPVGRWKKWNRVQKWIFNRIAGKANLALGYELAK